MDTLIGIAALTIFVSVPVSWLVAEIRNSPKPMRIALGLGCMLLLLSVLLVSNEVAVVRQRRYDACITRIAELLGKGDQRTVQEAMAVWSKDRGERKIDRVNAILETYSEAK